MNVRILLLERLKRAALLVLLLCAVGMGESLAQTQVATLQHGEEISVFYGQNAFVEAHTTAETGDVITLSSGTFTGCDITKAVTIRGAGCAVDTITGTYPTIISVNIHMNVDGDSSAFAIEGILFAGMLKFMNLRNPKFTKCNFVHLSNANGASNMQNAQFVNCKFQYLSLGEHCSVNTMFVNCVIWDIRAITNSSITAWNSFIKLNWGAGALSAYNSIICQHGSHAYLESNSIAYNCIGIITTYSSIFNGIQTNSCIKYYAYLDVFDSFEGSNFSFDETFTLKEEIAASVLGNDGTEVGIYGGIMPYTSRPSYMLVKRCNVANRSTVDGKLSVDVEVITEDN